MKRKDFVGYASGLMAGLIGLPAFAMAQPGGRMHHSGKNPRGCKITGVRTYVHPKACFVKIETDAGVDGWGEADHDHTAVVAKIMGEVYRKWLIGKDPFESEAIWHELWYKGEDLGLAGVSTGAIAGIDNALWDLKGKLLGMPVYKLLGGNNVQQIKVYASFGRGEGKNIKTPADCAALSASYVEAGYDTIKVRMQLRTLGRNPEPDPTEAYVKEVRQAIGDKINLFVDFNNGYTAGKAVELILRLYEKYNIALVEEPVHYRDYEGLRQCVEASPVRVAAGEHSFNRFDVVELITIGKADVIKAGGISETKKCAVLAQSFDREVMCHNARPTLANAATLHLVASIFNAARIQEFGGERAELGLWPYFENRFSFANGYLTVPQEPGLGLRVNEKAMAALEIKF